MTKRGRRPRGRTPMPGATITAFAEELAFLALLGNGSTSLGVQESVRRLVSSNEEAGRLMEQAKRMCKLAEERVREQQMDEVKQSDVYRYLSANLYELTEATR